MHNLKDFDNSLSKAVIRAMSNNKEILKTAKITGLGLPDGVYDQNLPVEMALPLYKKYVNEKAYEPKSKWLVTTIYPAAIGSALAHLAVRGLEAKNLLHPLLQKYKPAVIAGVGLAAGGIGAAMKISDDKKIDTSRMLLRAENQDRELLKALLSRRKWSQNKSGLEVYDTPNLKNFKKSNVAKEIAGLVGTSAFSNNNLSQNS